METLKCSSWGAKHFKLLQAKRDTAYGEKPEAVKTHLRNMVIVLLGPSPTWLVTLEGCLDGVPRNIFSSTNDEKWRWDWDLKEL